MRANETPQPFPVRTFPLGTVTHNSVIINICPALRNQELASLPFPKAQGKGDAPQEAGHPLFHVFQYAYGLW
jgi:hypothetical protein